MIVADSSSIISLAMNCLSCILERLDLKVTVTPTVYNEIITRPMNNRRYALEAYRIKRLIKEGTIVTREADKTLTDQIMDQANLVYLIRKKPLEIIHEGEAEALALVKELGAEGFLIDERTTRLLLEDPEELKKVLEIRNHTRVDYRRGEFEKLKGMLPKVPIIRSAEVCAIAYEKGVLRDAVIDDDGRLFDAVLSALKFSGCSITWDEIEEYKRVIASP